MDRIISLFAWQDLGCIVLLEQVITVTAARADSKSLLSSLLTFTSVRPTVEQFPVEDNDLEFVFCFDAPRVLVVVAVERGTSDGSAITSMFLQACWLHNAGGGRHIGPVSACAASPSFRERRGFGGREVVWR